MGVPKRASGPGKNHIPPEFVGKACAPSKFRGENPDPLKEKI